MQLRIGMELIANIDPGIIIEHITKVYRLKIAILSSGVKQKIAAHSLMMN
jgi:hypothetical protein